MIVVTRESWGVCKISQSVMSEVNANYFTQPQMDLCGLNTLFLSLYWCQFDSSSWPTVGHFD